VSRAAAQKAVADLQAKGMQFNELSPAEQARMRTDRQAGPRQVRRVRHFALAANDAPG
jgi:hypothetical protein